MIVCGTSRYIVHHQRSCGTPVIRSSDSPEPFLACSVPNLQLDLLSANVNDSGAKFNTNGVWTIGHNYDSRKILVILKCRFKKILTFLLCELMKKARFTNSHISDNYVFKNVRIIVGTPRHDWNTENKQFRRLTPWNSTIINPNITIDSSVLSWTKNWKQYFNDDLLYRDLNI